MIGRPHRRAFALRRSAFAELRRTSRLRQAPIHVDAARRRDRDEKPCTCSPACSTSRLASPCCCWVPAFSRSGFTTRSSNWARTTHSRMHLIQETGTLWVLVGMLFVWFARPLSTEREVPLGGDVLSCARRVGALVPAPTANSRTNPGRLQRDPLRGVSDAGRAANVAAANHAGTPSKMDRQCPTSMRSRA